MTTENKLDELPRFKVVGDHFQFVLGIPRKPGFEFDCRGWPPEEAISQLEPLNESARRVLTYMRARPDPWRPASPTADYGEMFLPRGGFAPARESFGEVREKDREPNMPTWRATRDIPVSGDPMRRAFPRREIFSGEVLTICDWPSKFSYHGLEPENAEARAIAEYETRAGDHPKKPVAPWCEYRRGMFLPDLPPTTYYGELYPAVAAGETMARARAKAA